MVDQSSRYVWLLLVKARSDIPPALKEWITAVRTQFKTTPVCFRMDRAGEHTGPIAELLKEQGVKLDLTPAGVSEMNGLAERYVGLVTSVARTLRVTADLPKRAWGEMVTTAAYLLNVRPGHNGHSPYELLHGKAPDTSRLRVVGARVFVARQGVEKSDKV